MKHIPYSSHLKVASITATSVVPSPTAPFADKTMSRGVDAAIFDVV